MRIRVTTDGCPFEREIDRLIHLFIEDAHIVWAEAGDAAQRQALPGVTPVAAPLAGEDLAIELRVWTESALVHAAGTLVPGEGCRTAHPGEGVPVEGTSAPSEPHRSGSISAPLSARWQWPLPPGADAVTWRRRAKLAVLHVLHELLAQWTGDTQPWGILSGIRPMKLVHAMRTEGLGPDEVRRRLTEDYLISPERADLLLEIQRVQLEVVPDLDALWREVSVYVGIPFCPTHCAYCTFPAYSMAEKAAYVDGFLEAMTVEIEQLAELLRAFAIPVTTVYIGGGTPTSLRADELDRLLDLLTSRLPGAGRWREFTVEAGRPDTITPDRMRVLRRYGVDRISVNPQTYNARTLRTMGRGHTPEMVDHRFLYAREAGFHNINMDIIVGLPGETADDVRHTMERVERLGPDSITVHTLAFKRSAQVRDERDRLQFLANDELRRLMDEVSVRIRGQGLVPYYLYRQKDILGNLENVGYARPGKASPYNILMMEEKQTVVGIGGGAVTKLIGPGLHLGRFANPREPRAYIETIHDVIRRKERPLRQVFEAIRSAAGSPTG